MSTAALHGSRKTWWALLSVLAFLVAGDGSGVQPAGPLVFTHATVIDGTGAAPLRDASVVIVDGRIRAVGPASAVEVPAGAEIVDATGKFLIPGLMDMHVHAIWDYWIEQFLPLFIANGVTTVRDMYGDLALAAKLKQDIAQGARLAPRFTTGGPIVDGPEPIWPGSIAVADAAAGRQAVHTVKQRGADFLKVYSLLPREAYLAVADEARKEGLSFAGHVPNSVSAREAAESGQKSIEHLHGVHLAASREEDSLRVALLALKGNIAPFFPEPRRIEARAVATYDAKKAEALFERFARHGTWQVPTLTVLRSFAYRNDPAFRADARIKYIGANTRKQWTPPAKPMFPPPGPEELATARTIYDEQVKLVGAMHRARVPILAGTDTPNPYVFPGFSLHDELELLVKAGMTPLEALQAATRNASQFSGTLQEVGTVERGKRADLVLLDANPLDDIRHTQRIRAVVVNGRLISRSQLDAMLGAIERTNAGASTQSNAAPQAPPLVVQGGTLIDVRTGQHVESSLVVIEGDRIREVGRPGEVRVPEGARIIDARGAWVIPGLTDFHAHAGARADVPLELYLANGVTTIRDPGGSIARQKQIRADVESGKRVGPRMYFAGAILDGRPPVWPESPVIETPEEATRVVQSLIADGADCIKVYNNITEPVLAAIIAAARAGGVPVTGHVPRTMTTTRAVEMGLDRLEHIRITGRELLPAADAERIDPLPLGVRETLLWERFDLDSAPIRRLVALLVEKKVFLDPTLAVDESVFMGLAAGQASHANNRYLPNGPPADPPPSAAVIQIYRIPPELTATAAAGFEKRLRFVGMANRAGVQVVAGTDGPGLGTLLPGFGLQHELELLVRAGLTPLQALQAATITAARGLNRERTLGTIEPGKFADLLILEGDPRQEIRNASRIRLVIKAGQSYEPQSLLRVR